MKKSGFFKERIYPVLFMSVLTAVAIAVTSGIYLATGSAVEKNAALFLKRAVLAAADILPDAAKADQIDSIYAARVEAVLKNDKLVHYYKIHDDKNNLEAYVFLVSGPGLWGEITAAVGLKTDKSTITGIEFIKQNETPGLGARITEPWFKEQFRGIEHPVVPIPEGNPRKTPNEINVITGATRTSEGILKIINSNLDKIVNQELE